MSNARRLGPAAIWPWPLVLGALTSLGLIAALFSDGGLGDALADVCLGFPVAVAVWFGWLRRERATWPSRP